MSTPTKLEKIVESIEEEIVELEEEEEPEIQKEYKASILFKYNFKNIINIHFFTILIIIYFFISNLLWYFYIHTFSTSYFQLVLLTCIGFLVWLQHLFCGACLFFNIECKLIGNHTTIIDHIFHLCNIPTSDDMKNGVLFMISSVIMCMLSCEVLSRTIINIKSL